MERQLNLAFPAGGRIEPFRFFAVEAAPAFHLGLAYDHFIAGGDSIARLLQRLVEDYCGIIRQPARHCRAPICTLPDIVACSLARRFRWRGG